MVHLKRVDVTYGKYVLHSILVGMELSLSLSPVFRYHRLLHLATHNFIFSDVSQKQSTLTYRFQWPHIELSWRCFKASLEGLDVKGNEQLHSLKTSWRVLEAALHFFPMKSSLGSLTLCLASPTPCSADCMY